MHVAMVDGTRHRSVAKDCVTTCANDVVEAVDGRGRVNGNAITLRAEHTIASIRIGRRGPMVGRVEKGVRMRRNARSIHRRLKVVGFSEADDGRHDGFGDHGDHTGFRMIQTINVP